MKDFDVCIVGLGPTGLLLAHSLGKAGHSVVVLEREPTFYGNARAVYTDDECMRLLQAVEMADELADDMLCETPVQAIRPDGTVIGQYTPLARPYGWPVVNFYYQPYLETTLGEALARYPAVEVRRGRELVTFEQDVDGVSVRHRATRSFRFREDDDARTTRTDAEDDGETLRARYLVGADGGRSTVRALLGIEMTGESFPEPWLVVDLEQKVRGEGVRHLPYFSFVVDPASPTVCCVQPDGFHRFEFRLGAGDDREAFEHPDKVRELLARWVDPDAFHVRRKLVYTFNALVAARWRVGRVLLAGDAAHMTPQFMGQGASSGFRDAGNLGWKLDLVLRGHADESLLDTYERERAPHAKAMIDTSVQVKNLVSMSNPVGAFLRDVASATLLRIPGLRGWLKEGGFKPKPAYAKGTYLGLPRVSFGGPEGTLSPQPEVRSSDGRRVRLDSLTGPGFALVGLGVDPRVHLSDATRRALEALGARAVSVYAFGERPQGLKGISRDYDPGLVELEDVEGTLLRFLRRGGRRAPVAILRPDKFTYALVPALRLEQAAAQLLRELGSVR